MASWFADGYDGSICMYDVEMLVLVFFIAALQRGLVMKW